MSMRTSTKADLADRPALDLPTLVAQYRASDAGSRELECLAVGRLFRIKSESLAGQLAVGEVIANRAHSGGRFPSSYCGVLFQRGQFSFVSGHSYPSVPRASRQWQNAVAIAKIVDQDLKDLPFRAHCSSMPARLSRGWRLTRVGRSAITSFIAEERTAAVAAASFYSNRRMSAAPIPDCFADGRRSPPRSLAVLPGCFAGVTGSPCAKCRCRTVDVPT